MPFAFFDPPAWINAHECLVVMSIIRNQKSGLLTLISLSFFLGSVYNKMSRKDKYETNNRRQQTFMSAEDVAAGRKSSWQGVEITGEWTRRQAAQRQFSCNRQFTGNVRNISPQLWQFEHLTALYLNDNCLSRLPSDIGLLVNLRTLDLSNNKLRSLPAELGELIQLRWVEMLLHLPSHETNADLITFQRAAPEPQHAP